MVISKALFSEWKNKYHLTVQKLAEYAFKQKQPLLRWRAMADWMIWHSTPDCHTPSVTPAVLVSSVHHGWGLATAKWAWNPCIWEAHLSSAFMVFKWLPGKTKEGLFGERVRDKLVASPFCMWIVLHHSNKAWMGNLFIFSYATAVSRLFIILNISLLAASFWICVGSRNAHRMKNVHEEQSWRGF